MKASNCSLFSLGLRYMIPRKTFLRAILISVMIISGNSSRSVRLLMGSPSRKKRHTPPVLVLLG